MTPPGSTPIERREDPEVRAALAETLARRGFDLIVVARRRAELEALAEHCRDAHGAEVRVLPMDLLEAGAAGKLVGSRRRACAST